SLPESTINRPSRGGSTIQDKSKYQISRHNALAPMIRCRNGAILNAVRVTRATTSNLHKNHYALPLAPTFALPLLRISARRSRQRSREITMRHTRPPCTRSGLQNALDTQPWRGARRPGTTACPPGVAAGGTALPTYYATAQPACNGRHESRG